MKTEVINGIEVTDYRSTHPPPPDTLAELRDYINKLVEERDGIQKEIDEHSAILRREKNVGMDGPLVDEEQFPRSDIDIVAVRTSRQRMICLTNDMRGVMERVEIALFKLHQMSLTGPAGGAAADTTAQEAPLVPPTRPPFLLVKGVLPDSPAHTSGLRDGDQICQMGSLHKDNFTSLGDVAEVVKLSVNKAVPVKLLREGNPKTLALKPRTWQGRGVLGCNVVELEG